MARKKSNGEGSITKRKDGRYMGRYTVEGKRYAVYGDTYAETRVKLTEVLANIDKGVFIISSNSTLSRWLREWLVDYALPTVKQSTYVSYEAYARLHVEPALGRIKLCDLTVERFQKFFNKKHKATGNEKSLSEKSLRNLYNMLHNCLEQAVINGHLMRNPINGVKLPTVPKREKRILSQAEQIALQAAASQSRTLTAFAIIFTLSTGVRLGELLGLQWGDVDYVNHSVTIRRTVGRLHKIDENGYKVAKAPGIVTTEIVTKTPKSVTSMRTIPLFDQVWNDLMIYKGKQEGLFLSMGLKVTSETFIFSSPATGGVYEPRTFEDVFKRTLDEAGLRDINFHALRHTFATRALEAGMDIKVLSSLLGHAQASTTLNFYAHALPDHKKDSMEKMVQYYGKGLGN